MTLQQAAALRKAGATDTEGFLEAAKTPAGRRGLSAETGISNEDILNLANRADPMRVNGIGEKHGDLLEIAGVYTPYRNWLSATLRTFVTRLRKPTISVSWSKFCLLFPASKNGWPKPKNSTGA